MRLKIHFLDLSRRGKDTGEVMPRARYSGVGIAPDRKAGVYYSKLFSE